MRLKNAFLSLLLLICPCALCYGQVSFSSVHGERGYSALRGSFALDLDNGWVLTPLVGYYRPSDSEQDEKGSTSRYGLRTRYEVTDTVQLLGDFIWHPKAIGYQAVLYYAGVQWEPFYYWRGIKTPFLRGSVGQSRYRSSVNDKGESLSRTFREVETNVQLETGAERKNWHLKAQWNKVLKYSEPLAQDMSFSWADFPYLSAVVQGFVKEAAALQTSYTTDLLAPYAGLVRYRYAQKEQDAFAIMAGLRFKLWGASFLGGIEVFEPRREENRKTFFSLSVEAEL